MSIYNCNIAVDQKFTALTIISLCQPNPPTNHIYEHRGEKSHVIARALHICYDISSAIARALHICCDVSSGITRALHICYDVSSVSAH